ncbi:hypothetical protein C2845_PM04G11830 [Panicum miliaceum]|uniref:Protein kinase domain-containing protein n=1 Tax=Panicum miliaceum TaxID=4540 RepID=A0A3L6QPL3_PANMI|nr:hypothetical protein C2845_PM04G11830 [Panicum miliaceum]
MAPTTSPPHRHRLLAAATAALLLLLAPSSMAAETPVSFSFPSFSLRNLTLLGGASLRADSVSLAPPSSHALFPLPLPFPPNASFSASFLFTAPASARPVSRLSFLLIPDPLTAGATVKNRSLPLEVTLDASKGRVSASSSGAELAGNSTGAVNLRNGNGVGSWVIYDARRARLEVFLSHASVRPRTPTLVFDAAGLAARFAEFMFVGLEVSSDNNAISDGGFVIENWTFLTSGLPTVDPVSRPAHSASDSVRSVPALPGVTTARKVTVFVVMSLKKWRWDTAALNEGVGAKTTGKPRQFMYQDLFSATKGFDPSMVVGSGGFGTVYKAVCPHSGVTYAVKRSKQSRESYNEFSAELSIIAAEAPQSGTAPRVSQRYNVAVGIASAVAYLHEEHDKQVIHRDIKSSNILLDSWFSPRLGDFRLARLKDHDTSPRSTLAAGTVGYLAPEYLQMGKATEKSDIYSYGVVLLEICTGKWPIETETPDSMNMLNVVDWVWNLHSKGRLLDAADPNLSGQYDNEQMSRLLLLGLSCVNPFSEERPVMRTVLGILEGQNEQLPVPRKKPLLVFVSNAPIDLDGIISECNQSTISSDLYELKIDLNPR